MTSADELKLSLVCPKLAAKIRQLASLLAAESITIRVTQGLRSWGDQQKLYAQGRTTPGKIVTNAPPGHSYHQFGLACDVAPFDADGQPDWNVSHPSWGRIIALGESLGLVSGSTFVTCPDDPHMQLTGKFGVSPTDEVRQIFLHVGMQAVWVEAGLFTTSP